jgi:dTDP-4-dehydrorhamnose 3,5-epimerase
LGCTPLYEKNQLNMSGILGVDFVQFPINYDSRGYFKRLLEESGSENELRFLHSSISRSTLKGTLRGLHFQSSPSVEWKYVNCVKGQIFDCLIDVRLNSPSYGEIQTFNLTEDNNLGVCIPPGVAHGFQTLVDDAMVFYSMTDVYRPELSQTLSWNDPNLGIPWPMSPTCISSADELGQKWPIVY